jgi:hypothetical protein
MSLQCLVKLDPTFWHISVHLYQIRSVDQFRVKLLTSIYLNWICERTQISLLEFVSVACCKFLCMSD